MIDDRWIFDHPTQHMHLTHLSLHRIHTTDPLWPSHTTNHLTPSSNKNNWPPPPPPTAHPHRSPNEKNALCHHNSWLRMKRCYGKKPDMLFWIHGLFSSATCYQHQPYSHLLVPICQTTARWHSMTRVEIFWTRCSNDLKNVCKMIGRSMRRTTTPSVGDDLCGQCFRSLHNSITFIFMATLLTGHRFRLISTVRKNIATWMKNVHRTNIPKKYISQKCAPLYSEPSIRRFLY